MASGPLHQRAAVAAALALVAVVAARALPGEAPAAPAGAPKPPLTAAARAASFTFDPAVSPINRQAFTEAVGRARPEAVALTAQVDGLVTIVDGPAEPGALGTTTTSAAGHTIRFPFGEVFARLGRRGLDRLVHHELGHVVEAQLLDPATRAALDAGIPPGQPCPAGTRQGSCAPPGERFAESYAKWATGDIGIALDVGYAVPPPPDLEAWGEPLARLAARGG